MAAKTAEYSGWTNWATWHVALLINNEEPSYKAAHHLAEGALRLRAHGKLNLDRLAQQFAQTFRGAERETRKMHENNAADARDERGKYEAEQLAGKPELTKEEIAALPSEERVKYIGD